MGALTEEDVSRFHEGFREGGVGMNAERQVGRQGRHFHRQHAFGDHFSRAAAGDADTEDALGFGVDDQFGDAVAVTQGQGAARSGPRKSGDGNVTLLLFGL